MDRIRAMVLMSFVLLMISSGSSPASAEEKAQGATGRSFEQARQRHARMGSGAPWISIMLRYRNQLNLTGEQVTTLEKLRSDFQQQVAPTQKELWNIEKEIQRLLQDNPVDLGQVKARIEEAEKFRVEFRYLRIETLEKGRAILTPEQRERLKNLTFSGRGQFRKPQGKTS